MTHCYLINMKFLCYSKGLFGHGGSKQTQKLEDFKFLIYLQKIRKQTLNVKSIMKPLHFGEGERSQTFG